MALVSRLALVALVALVGTPSHVAAQAGASDPAAAQAAVGTALARQRPFQADDIEAGRAQYHRTCAQCHGRNMVNAGTTIYDLRKFPTDQPDRFATSVAQGKGNMPSFRDALSSEQIGQLWAYVGSRGGKEP